MIAGNGGCPADIATAGHTHRVPSNVAGRVRPLAAGKDSTSYDVQSEGREVPADVILQWLGGEVVKRNGPDSGTFAAV